MMVEPDAQDSSSKAKSVLIVSPFFPPSTLAGVHRARHLASYLGEFGWEPTVLCVDPRHYVELPDPALERLVPGHVRIERAGAIPAAFTRPFGLNAEVGLRGWFHLRAKISQVMKARPADVVLITGSPFYPMLLAKWIKRRWGCKVVLDFQDPWVAKEGLAFQASTKQRISRGLARLLEPRALKIADWVTSVSDKQNSELADRNPAFARARMSAIPIGGDPQDFASVKRAPVRGSGEDFVFSYVGTALPRSLPLLKVLFEGFALLREQAPDLARKVKFRFVGTSNQPGGTRHSVLPVAQSAGVADQVVEEPGRVPFLDALQILASTEATMMIGSDEPHYTASKIYPCLMAGRPFISIFHSMSSAHEVLSQAGGGLALSFSSQQELDALGPKVAAALRAIAANPAALGPIDAKSYSAFTAQSVAGEFARVFDGLVP